MSIDAVAVKKLRRTGLSLVWVGEIWNLVEAAVAIWSGLGSSSVALLAFGFDSFIELFAGGVLIWHLSKEWGGTEANEITERRARRMIGYTFLFLSALILTQSIATLTGLLPTPEESFVGIALVVVSAVIMFALYRSKIRVAGLIDSSALRAEAMESLICDVQDLTLLVGLGLNALVGWWWADPVAALALIPWLVHEGREALEDGDDEGIL